MTTTRDPLLKPAIEAVLVPGVWADYRLIENGDECALLPEELVAFSASAIKVRRASGAARIIARELLLQFGIAKGPIAKSASGMPVWPVGIVGSLAHDPEVSIAAVALRRNYLSLGIDIEPAAALDSELLDIVATARERQMIAEHPLQGRLLFSIKEAVYKAVYPLDGAFLEHHDVEVCLASKTAIVCDGRIVNFRYYIGARIIALAFISASPNSALDCDWMRLNGGSIAGQTM
jgi:4'-phosphopantetheinyl transferase EntD